MSLLAEAFDPPLAELPSAEIDDVLRSGAILLTPHARLARYWSAVWDQQRRSEGLQSWQPAKVLPWRAWTSSTWKNAMVTGVETRVVLNDLQEAALWEDLLRKEGGAGLQSIPALVRLCSGAVRLLGAYDLTGRFAREFHRIAPGSDAETFAHWHARFEDCCSRGGYLPLAHVDQELARHVCEGHLSGAAQYVLAGFDRLTPAQVALLDAVRGAGAHVCMLQAASTTADRPALVRCADADDELMQCATWLRQRLQNDPDTQAVIVMPDLHECRVRLERILREIVAPEQADVTASEQAPPYEFSTGRALASLPMVADALCLLRWCVEDVSLEEAGRVLRSSFLCLAPSPERGAELDMWLQEQPVLRGELSLQTAADLLHRGDQATANGLRLLAKSARPQRSSDGWAHQAGVIRQLLHDAGWPGLGPLNSEEFQAAERWEETLDRVSTLDLLGHRASLADFVQVLERTARDTVFAPENTGAPVQVVTPMEAAGMTAAALWCLHMTESTWPPRSAPHPLLPSVLQRDLGMPGSDPAKDDADARAVTARLLCNASEVRFSYAASLAEGAQRPSPLVAELPGLQHETATPLARDVEVPRLTTSDDAGALPPLPDGITAGGVSVLKAQAQCGFRAFAEKRLFATEPGTRETGHTPRERGDHVHDVLQKFWERVRDHATLAAMGKDMDADGLSRRDRMLWECIDACLPPAPQGGWSAAYTHVQRERLFKLLQKWLEYEAARPPFTVQATEMKVPGATIGPLKLDIRIDRIDRVGSGTDQRNVLIDYKTGSASRAQWESARPDEPQLPLYAVAGGVDDVAGLAFGLVSLGKDRMQFNGVVEDARVLTGKRQTVDLEAAAANWRTDLERLADAYASGDATVDPKSYPVTCTYCAQRLLCRLDAATLLDIEDDANDEENSEG